MPVCSGIGGAGEGVPIWPASNDPRSAAPAVLTDAANAVASVDSTSGVCCAHAGATAAVNRITMKHRAVDVIAVSIGRTCARVVWRRHDSAGEPEPSVALSLFHQYSCFLP